MAVRPSEGSFTLQIECGSFAVDHFAVLQDRNINVGAAFGNLLPGAGHYGDRWLTLLRRLALGRARFTSLITHETEMLNFGVVHFGDHNLHGGVSVFANEDAYREMSRLIRDAFARSDVPDTIHLIDRLFGGQTYSLKNLFRDEQRKIMQEVLKPAMRGIESAYRQLYDQQAPLVRFMHDCRIHKCLTLNRARLLIVT